MIRLQQECPYCGFKPNPLHCIWEEGTHFSKCEQCEKHYEVNINFEFVGLSIFEIQTKEGIIGGFYRR